MKFEQLLQIYWSRGFLYGGKVHTFNVTLRNFFGEKTGLGDKAASAFVKRFEMSEFAFKKDKSLITLSLDERKVINMQLSRIASINNSAFDLIRYNLLRLYLIRAFRGRCHALGKPSRGQRTWSNASTAFQCDREVRLFIRRMKKDHTTKKKPEVRSKKIIKKKLKVRVPSTKPKTRPVEKKKPLWF